MPRASRPLSITQIDVMTQKARRHFFIGILATAQLLAIKSEGEAASNPGPRDAIREIEGAYRRGHPDPADEESLEVVSYGPKSVYFRLRIPEKDFSYCSIWGIAELDGGRFLYRDPDSYSGEENQKCKLSLWVGGDRVRFSDEKDSCRSYCKTRGLSNVWFPHRSRRKIRYLDSLKTSLHYFDAQDHYDGMKTPEPLADWSWLLQYRNRGNEALSDERFDRFMDEAIPRFSAYFGMEAITRKTRLKQVLREFMNVPNDEDIPSDTDTVLLSGWRLHSGSEKAFLWVKPDKKQAVFGLIHYLFNKDQNARRSKLLYGSKQLRCSEIPDSAKQAIQVWLKSNEHLWKAPESVGGKPGPVLCLEDGKARPGQEEFFSFLDGPR